MKEERNVNIEMVIIFTIVSVLLFFATYSMISGAFTLQNYIQYMTGIDKPVHYSHYSSYVFMGIGPFVLMLIIWIYYLKRLLFTHKLRKNSLKSDKMV